jgi:hypothetical protein
MRRYVHFDANFRLVLLKSDKRDPSDRSFWDGGGFFADPMRYQQYLSIADNAQQEVSLQATA